MARPTLTGSRIRRHRMDRGIRQAELARSCEISPSYLNLIEHNRRRIGGALLNKIARGLGVDPVFLSEGAEASLTAALETAAAAIPEVDVPLERADAFASGFPGWARLVHAQNQRREALERVIEVLNDRLTHDPHLSASLHDVLSTVTAIRSTSGILSTDDDIEPEWRARFHRNLYEDSQRLAESAEALVTYLDAAGDAGRRVALPQEDVEAWLEMKSWSVDAIEAGQPIDEVLEGDAMLGSPSALSLARSYLERYRQDAEAIPRSRLLDALEEGMLEPAALAARFGVNFDVMLRRLASMPSDAFTGGLAPGLVVCDASGTLTFRKAVRGFEPPKFGAACALWPLYEALRRPMQPLRVEAIIPGRDTRRFTLHAYSTTHYPAGFDKPGVVESTMLIVPVIGDAPSVPHLEIGSSCRVCAVEACVARREPSILTIAEKAETPDV